jgi:4-hydroxy-tetrahydrodipicolinate reductase
MTVKVAISGVLGKMGQEVKKAVEKEDDLVLVGMADVKLNSADNDENDVITGNDLDFVLKKSNADVLVDFTQPDSVMQNIEIALRNEVAVVVGTTGLTENNLNKINMLSEEKNVGVLIAPNFAIGAVLMMHYSSKISKYMSNVEIIELHHNKKLDAPSGTAIKTAQMLNSGQSSIYNTDNSAYGSIYNGVKIHSVRLPGFIAHQEVIFGSQGQSLTIRHDTTSREAFMPGVIMAVREVGKFVGLIYGLENLLDL